MADDRLPLFYRISEFNPELELSAAYALYQDEGDLLYAMIESEPCYEIHFGQAFPDSIRAKRLDFPGLQKDSAHCGLDSVWLQQLQ